MQKTQMRDFLKHLEQKDYWIIGIISLIFIALAFSSALYTPIFADEPIHVASGYTKLVLHDYRMNTEAPPLVNMLSASPLVSLNLKDFTDTSYWYNKEMVNYSCEFTYHNNYSSQIIVLLSRIPIILMGLLVGLMIFYFVYNRYGKTTAFIVFALYSTYPMILTHSSIAYVDFGFLFFNFLTFFALMEFIRTKKNLYLYLFFIGFSLTFLTKFTALFNFIFYPLIILLNYKALKLWWKPRKWKALWHILAFIGIFYITILIGYGFQQTFVPLKQALTNDPFIHTNDSKYLTAINMMNSNPITRFAANIPNPFPYYFAKGLGFWLFDAHNSNVGIMGIFRQLREFLLKNTLTIILLIAAYIYLIVNKYLNAKKYLLVKSHKKTSEINKQEDTNFFYEKNFIYYILFFFLVFSISGAYAYHRYVLMIYPFLILLLARPISAIINSKMKRSYKILIITGLLLIHIIPVLMYYPQFYQFNSCFQYILGPAVNDLPLFASMYGC